jgi:hypothetical protein
MDFTYHGGSNKTDDMIMENWGVEQWERKIGILHSDHITIWILG